jgi:hypothetical protein
MDRLIDYCGRRDRPLCLTTAAIPPEDQLPLIIDADRMEARQVAAELFEVVARRHPQIRIGGRIVDHLEFAKQPAFEIGRMCRDGLSSTKKARSLVPKACNHAAARSCV